MERSESLRLTCFGVGGPVCPCGDGPITASSRLWSRCTSMADAFSISETRSLTVAIGWGTSTDKPVPPQLAIVVFGIALTNPEVSISPSHLRPQTRLYGASTGSNQAPAPIPWKTCCLALSLYALPSPVSRGLSTYVTICSGGRDSHCVQAALHLNCAEPVGATLALSPPPCR